MCNAVGVEQIAITARPFPLPVYTLAAKGENDKPVATDGTDTSKKNPATALTNSHGTYKQPRPSSNCRLVYPGRPQKIDIAPPWCRVACIEARKISHEAHLTSPPYSASIPGFRLFRLSCCELPLTITLPYDFAKPPPASSASSPKVQTARNRPRHQSRMRRMRRCIYPSQMTPKFFQVSFLGPAAPAFLRQPTSAI